MGVNVTFFMNHQKFRQAALMSCSPNHLERLNKSAVVPSIPNQPIALNRLSHVPGRLYQSERYRRHMGSTYPPACLSLCPAGVLYFMG